MRIALVGYGAMGQLIAAEALRLGHQIASSVDPSQSQATHKELGASALNGADVVIDFTHPSVALKNIEFYCLNKVPAVIGTTGWYDKLDQTRALAAKHSAKIVWSSNFSIGVNAFFRIVECAAKLMNQLEDYDAWGYEVHHFNKADSPSGTAKTMAELVIKNMPRKSKAVYDKLDRKIAKDELHIASVRGGEVNFEHTLAFDSAADCISIKHAARNRAGYARGAIHAAQWLLSKPSGFYSATDFLNEILPIK